MNPIAWTSLALMRWFATQGSSSRLRVGVDGGFVLTRGEPLVMMVPALGRFGRWTVPVQCVTQAGGAQLTQRTAGASDHVIGVAVPTAFDLGAYPDLNARRASVAAAESAATDARGAALVVSRFVCTVSDNGSSVVWVKVAGSLDLATVPKFEQVMRHAELGAGLLLLDLRRLTSVDAAAVCVIVDAGHRARLDRRRLVVTRGSHQVESLLALSGAAE
ncbi:MAG TPA: STAS domain-containing protein, partial [Vicinamibacterales bacterium]